MRRFLDRNPDRFTTEKKLCAVSTRLFDERPGETRHIDYTNRWNEDPAQGLNRRDFTHACACHDESEREVLPPALSPKIQQRACLFPQSGADASSGNGDKHSSPKQLYRVSLGVLEDLPAAFQGQLGFSCP